MKLRSRSIGFSFKTSNPKRQRKIDEATRGHERPQEAKGNVHVSATPEPASVRAGVTTDAWRLRVIKDR